MIKRLLYEQITAQSNQYPALALTGTRQSGKTTLFKTMFSAYRFVSLENSDSRVFA